MKDSDANERGSELVVIRRFPTAGQTLLAKGILESAGIECFLWDEQMVGMDWLAANAFGGMKLVAKRQDADTAYELLNQVSGELQGATEPPEEQPGPSG